MRQFSKYLLEKLVIDKDTKRTHIYEGTYDKNARHICWLFGRIDKDQVNSEKFPSFEEAEEQGIDGFGPIAQEIYKWVKRNDVKSYRAIADIKELEANKEDDDVIDYFDDEPKTLEVVCRALHRQNSLAMNGRYELHDTCADLLLRNYKNERLSKLIKKV